VLDNRSPNPPQATVEAKPEDLQLYIDIGNDLGLFSTRLDAKKIVLS